MGSPHVTSHPRSARGFTLVEIMVVVAIIGLLAALAIVGLRNSRERTLGTRIANDLRQFQTAFAAYSFEHSGWPPAAGAGVIPTGMEGYLSRSYLNTVEPGGAYSWSGESGQLQFTPSAANERVMQIVDSIIDNGDPASGAFTGSGTRYQLQL